MAQRDRQRKPHLSLSIQASQPLKVDDGWEVKIVATVLYGNRAPEPPREVVFALDGTEQTQDFSDDSGISKATMFARESGEHIATVFLRDFLGLRRHHRFLIREEKEKTKRAKELRIWTPGRDGKYSFSVSVVAEDGTPANGVLVRIFNERGLVGQWETNEKGTVDPAPSVEFSEPMMEFVVDVVGTELDRRLRLIGRSRFVVPPEVPPEIRSQGRWAVFKFAFRTNNNVRLAVLWLATGILFLFNLFVFGVGPAAKSPIGETAQKYYNLYYHGELLTDVELNPIFSSFGGLWEMIRSGAWWLWLLLFLGSVVYFPIALRDEVSRAWEVAWRKARERRGGEEKAHLPSPSIPPVAQPSQPATPSAEQPLGFRRYLIWEVITDFLSAFLSHAFVRR